MKRSVAAVVVKCTKPNCMWIALYPIHENQASLDIESKCKLCKGDVKIEIVRRDIHPLLRNQRNG